jgi:hypothetical protein
MKDDGPDTRHIVTQFLEWLLIPHNKAIAFPWLSDDDELGDIWEWQLKLLISRITLVFDQNSPADNLARLNFMQLLLCKDTYTSKGISSGIADSIRQSIASHLLIRKNIYSTIHTYFSEHGKEQMGQIEAMVRLLVNIIKIQYQTPGFSSGGEDFTKIFVMQILTIRSLAEQISPRHYASLLQVVGIERVLHTILRVGQEQSLEGPKLVGLLENTISIKSNSQLALSPQDMVSHSHLIRFLWIHYNSLFPFVRSNSHKYWYFFFNNRQHISLYKVKNQMTHKWSKARPMIAMMKMEMLIWMSQ